MSESFSKRLVRITADSGSNICVGIDPHVDRLPPFFQSQFDSSPEQYLFEFSSCLIEAAVEHRISAVKFQSSFFEIHGPIGFAALKASIELAKTHKIEVILDAKRGDISSTMKAYGSSAFECLKADSLTINPYMGTDVLKALGQWLERGKGAYVVWVSSNPSGHLIQDKVAKNVFETFTGFCKENGWNESIGFVLGATKIVSLSEDLLNQAKCYPLLLPGFGAQGAQLTPPLQSVLGSKCGSLLPVSRGISGIGLEDQLLVLQQIDSWTKFRNYASENLKNISNEFQKKSV